MEFALVNVGVSSVIGGIGAIINKEPEEQFSKVLLKGFAQGALGGYVVFESKRMLREFSQSENYAYVWPSKLVNAAGNSIIENAAGNQNFWVKWHLNIGFNRFDIYTKDKFRLRYRIMPFSLGSTISGFINYSFDFSQSLTFGTFVFTDENISIDGINNFDGATGDNLFVLKENSPISIKAHEIIHTYQYEQLSGINMYVSPISTKLESKSKLFKFYQKYFYTDYNSVLKKFLYQIEKKKSQNYSDNLFEKEAYYFMQ
ncbi:hypothetical protein [Gillisia sp. Hel_I_29]|uniref:hypothetical protein n=1 Tax=Gillisia sp. Hel_I_29 TaxID=1249975 RepID=UPI000551E1B6|nr:hypothetical protein [Gillisia sp. Hel_I_29]